MAGGNHYDVSDFSVASKWFFNWVTDSSIIKMQPEGPTAECPACIASGTFTMKPFDMRGMIPTSSDILGIHIPIANVYSERYQTNWVYSYWISYRSGVDGDASGGISIHLSWFEMYGLVGSYYDSMMYDAFGHTSSKLDSFVLENSCYHISPASYMRDEDFDSVEMVQPVVCVDNINVGSDVTVSISFFDKENPPATTVDLIEQPSINCLTQTTPIVQSIDETTHTLLHFSNPGRNGVLEFSLDDPNDGETPMAYVYDK